MASNLSGIVPDVQTPDQPSFDPVPIPVTHSVKDHNPHPWPVLPAADHGASRGVVPQIVAWPWTDKTIDVLKGIDMIPNIIKSKETRLANRETTGAIMLYRHRDNTFELEMCLGQADEGRCLEAADQARGLFGKYPGTSVKVELVRRMKIAVPDLPDSQGIRESIFEMFT
jgi:hypothetical protein